MIFPLHLDMRQLPFGTFGLTYPHNVTPVSHHVRFVEIASPLPYPYSNTIEINLQRIAIGPPTEEEVAAAIQYAIDHAADSQTSQGQAAAGAQGSEVCTQGQPAS
jgi:hypothetical protein